MMPERVRGMHDLDELTAIVRTYGGAALLGDVEFIIDQFERGAASVAVLGQFKRGKSTLLNALIGEEILPTGRLPLTGVTTRVLFGERGLAVHYLDGRTEIADLTDVATYVTEARNPKNRLKVAHVDVALPLPLLRDVVLIDTPGIGSTDARNTDVAREASGRVDLAVFVTGPEPPITGEELAFVVDARALAERIVVVVAKIDLVCDEQVAVLDFTRRTLEDTLHENVSIYAVDARSRDERIATLREAIVRIVSENGGVLARRSLARRIRRTALHVRRAIALQRAAALLPASERERARATFAELADEIDERGADLIRAIEQFPTEELVSVDALLESSLVQAAATLAHEIPTFVAKGAAGERAIHVRVAQFEEEWSTAVSSAIEKRIDKRRASMLRLLAELETRFAQAASAALGLRLDDDMDTGLEFGAREAATRMSGPIPTTGLELVAGGLVAALPGSLRTHALRKRFGSLVPELLDRSRGRVRSAAVRYLLEWRLANVRLVRERLVAARRVVEGAFDRACEAGAEPETQQLMQRMERDEGILDAIVAAFD